MSKIAEVIGKPAKVEGPTGTKTLRITFQTYKIETDADCQELMQVFNEDVSILLTTQGDNFTYVMVKRVEEIKVAL